MSQKTDLERLKKQRSSHRGQVTKLISKAENRLINPDVEIDELEGLLIQLQTKDEQLKSIDSKIENVLALTEIESEIEKIDEYNEDIVFTSVKLKNKIKLLQSVTEQIISNGRESPSNRNKSNSNAKLPKLKIQTYYGDPAEYLNFWNQFENAVDKNSSLSNIEKFSYLFSSLGGDALSCIKGFAISDDNYESAIKLLKDTFGQTDVLINAHVSKLLNMSPLKNSSNLQELRNFYFKCQTQIRSLDSLGVKSDTYSVMLSAIILKLFPSDLALEFSKAQISSSNHNLEDLMKFLHDVVSVRQRTFQIQSPSHPPHRGENLQYKQFVRRPFGAPSRSKFASSASEMLTNASPRAVCSFCNSRHARAICFKLENSKNQKSENNSEKLSNEVVYTATNCMVNDKKGVLLQCVKVDIVGNKISDCVYALYDNGSERTFLRKGISEKLGLRVVGSEKLNIYSFGARKPRSQVCRKVEVKLRNILDGSEVVIEALEIEEISRASIRVPDWDVCVEMEKRGLALTFDVEDLSRNCQISLLVGADYYWDLVKGFQRLNSSLVAVETVLGWSLQGRCDELTESILVNFVISERELVSAEVRRFWELESLGIRGDGIDTGLNEQDILKEFDESIQFVDNRYCVKLPWKEGMQEKLGTNRQVALRRFNGLVERFKRDPELYREYGEVINGYLEEGIVERCTSERLADESSFYLPHHAVVRDDKVSSRLRIVFDGASHAEGQYSLNDCLKTGPNLYPNLFELLIKFRENAVTYIADIRQAFLQILIDAEDRPFTRFFWKEDLNSDKLTVLNFTRVLFGLTPSPYLLAATLKYHFEKNIDLFPETCESLLKSFWVDDLVGGADDVEQALKTTTESVKILKDAGMILRKWQTNSKELREDWKKVGIETHEDKTTLARGGVPTKVLGLAWDPDKDIIFFDVSKLMNILASGCSTKRFLLQILGRIFDPIGFLDASLAAYGTVLYLPGVTRNGKIIVNFLCSKSRVAPLKSLTLPRLELLGCLLSARLAEQVSKCLKFEASCYFWTDSSICTYWIKGKADDYKPFVKNRVKEIQRLSERGNWSHCPGKENPADLLSRGIPASNLAKSSLWWHGPPWLSKPIYDSQFVFDLNKYSDLNKVLVITTLVKRFVNKLRKLPTEVGPCSAAELLEAEQDWIKFEQNLVYSSELERIKSGKQISKNSSLYKLAPYLDDNNVLRVRGRLEESEFSSNEIHPIILPKQSKFSELLIRREHNKVCHGGVSATLSKIRSRYWIPKGRQIVKRVLRDCLICRKYSLKPAQQITAQLPKNRILENPPFTVTGIDFTGPVIIRSGKESNQKSYITLFTCAVTRALHLELTTDMTTKHFILSLRRFLARRGNCKVIISDNAKSFKATDNILREFAKILVDVDLKKFVGIHEINGNLYLLMLLGGVASMNGS
ncbi:hypothetical protein AVEN_47383-1 [Araneus ventricosus]|uniref:Integrase zinc-binding domain-containing protein n=1 Tax=Araneus ventricosus TaxID=182803 RepID=A0A4Y2X3X8_ARAVE|nr:hypothetical protein AVEN_47383-1 [Araneus ventricosus]